VISKEEILERVEEIPPLPMVAMKILRMASDPEAHAKDIVEVVRLDPAVTMRVIRMCNSPYYGLKREISSLHEALVYVGADTLISQVMVSCLSGLTQKPYPGYGLDGGDFWHHAVGSAIAAENIASQTHPKMKGQAFTGALLHDIGKLVMSPYVGADFKRLLTLVQENDVSFCQAEQELLGMSHPEVGFIIGGHWDLPEPLRTAIRYHHKPDEAPGDKELTALVHLGNILAMSFGLGLGRDGLAAELCPAAADLCGLTPNDLLGLAAVFLAQYREASELITQ
jgi:HD-like signal output (HDOD) protein